MTGIWSWGSRRVRTGSAIGYSKRSLDRHTLLNPFFDVNGALYLRRLFSKGARMMLLLRPCEIRAYQELVKLSQIEPEGIIAVSVDCLGTVSSKERTEGVPTDAEGLIDYFKDAGRMRPACRTCRERRGVVGDAGIRIGKDGALWAFSYTEKGEMLPCAPRRRSEEAPRRCSSVKVRNMRSFKLIWHSSQAISQSA